jgi:hypothetical protein
VIESISGLDPAAVTLFTGDFARDGGYYQGRRSSGRNPVFNLKLNPNYQDDIEVSDIREMLYDIFMEPSPTDDGLQVILKDDRKPDRYFIGYTEALPADMFSRDTKAQVSMLCVDPFLKSVDEVFVEDAIGWVSIPVTYDGSARTGLAMTFEIKTASNEMNVDINGVRMQITKPSGTWIVGDRFYINTLIGSRAVQHIDYDGGISPSLRTKTDVMAVISSASRWPQLNKGVNTIKSYGSVEADGKVVMIDYRYRAAWWGI